MGAVVTIDPYKSRIKRWRHKLFGCPTFWKSVWDTFFKSKPYYRCPECKKPMHCYWDGNDITNHGINFCDDCASKLEK